MPNYELFDDVYYRQTSRLFRTWLRMLRDEYKKYYPDHPFKIDEKSAKSSFDEGMTPHQCLSEKNFD